MSNVLAIARKELRGYFASPIAYIIIGFFALVFGWFFFVSITFFMQASLQMGMPGQGQINVNTMAIRPLLQNVSVVALFVLPLITMRTYSEEKRSGTIELLLTSPLTDTADRARQVSRRRRALRADAGGHVDSHRRSSSSTATRNGSRSSPATSDCCSWARRSSRSACSSRA